MDFRMKTDVAEQSFRVINIDWFRRDIQVPHPQNRIGRFEILVEVVA